MSVTQSTLCINTESLSSQNSIISPGNGNNGLKGLQVRNWLRSLRLRKYFKIFKNMSYGELTSLTEEKLKIMNIKRKDRRKLLLSLQKINNQPEKLKSIEKNLQEDENTIRETLNNIRNIIQTQFKFLDVSALPDSEGDLLGQITCLLEKICSILLSLPSQNGNMIFFVIIIDKCLSHKAFNSMQKQRLSSLKQQIIGRSLEMTFSKVSSPSLTQQSLDHLQKNENSEHVLTGDSTSLKQNMPIQHLKPPVWIVVWQTFFSNLTLQSTQWTSLPGVIKSVSSQNHLKPDVQNQKANSVSIKPNPSPDSMLRESTKALKHNQDCLEQHAINRQSMLTVLWQHHLLQIQGISQKQFKQNKQYFSAQLQLLQQQLLQIDEIIHKAIEEKMIKLARETEIDLKELDAVLQPVITSCAKDSISTGKKWIISHATSPSHSEVIFMYIFKKVTDVGATFEAKLHLIYLINDVLHHCIHKDSDDLKKVLEQAIVPIFCSTSFGVGAKKQQKLSQLHKLWGKNKYFEQNVLDQLQNPASSLAFYQAKLIVEYATLITPIISAIEAQCSLSQEQQEDSVASLEDQMQQMQKLQEPAISSATNQKLQKPAAPSTTNQAQVDEIIHKAQEEKITKLAHENEIDLQELDAVLQPIIDSCSKDSISVGTKWIFSHATSPSHSEVIVMYILKKVTELGATFEAKLHLIYLINDLLCHCILKNADDLKKVLELAIVPIFCSTSIDIDADKQQKLSKLHELWEKNKCFEQNVLDQLRNPVASFAAYQIQVDEIVHKAQEEKITRLAQENGIDLKEFDVVLQPIIDSCVKDSISAGRKWIFSHATSPSHFEVIVLYILKKVTQLGATFRIKLHLIYLIHDVLHHCVCKKADVFKKILERTIIPIFCSTCINIDPDKQQKLSKLHELWEKNKYFESDVLCQLQNPGASLATYQVEVIAEHVPLITIIIAAIQAQYSLLLKKHQNPVTHLSSQMQKMSKKSQKTVTGHQPMHPENPAQTAKLESKQVENIKSKTSSSEKASAQNTEKKDHEVGKTVAENKCLGKQIISDTKKKGHQDEKVASEKKFLETIPGTEKIDLEFEKTVVEKKCSEKLTIPDAKKIDNEFEKDVAEPKCLGKATIENIKKIDHEVEKTAAAKNNLEKITVRISHAVDWKCRRKANCTDAKKDHEIEKDVTEKTAENNKQINQEADNVAAEKSRVIFSSDNQQCGRELSNYSNGNRRNSEHELTGNSVSLKQSMPIQYQQPPQQMIVQQTLSSTIVPQSTQIPVHDPTSNSVSLRQCMPFQHQQPPQQIVVQQPFFNNCIPQITQIPALAPIGNSVSPRQCIPIQYQQPPPQMVLQQTFSSNLVPPSTSAQNLVHAPTGSSVSPRQCIPIQYQQPPPQMVVQRTFSSNFIPQSTHGQNSACTPTGNSISLRQCMPIQYQQPPHQMIVQQTLPNIIIPQITQIPTHELISNSISLNQCMPIQYQHSPQQMVVQQTFSSNFATQSTQNSQDPLLGIIRPNLQDHVKPQVQGTNSISLNSNPLSASVFGKNSEDLEGGSKEKENVVYIEREKSNRKYYKNQVRERCLKVLVGKEDKKSKSQSYKRILTDSTSPEDLHKYPRCSYVQSSPSPTVYSEDKMKAEMIMEKSSVKIQDQKTEMIMEKSSIKTQDQMKAEMITEKSSIKMQEQMKAEMIIEKSSIKMQDQMKTEMLMENSSTKVLDQMKTEKIMEKSSTKMQEETTVPITKKLDHEIEKVAAENNRCLFNDVDWQCRQCESVNFARRQKCIMCNAPKIGEVGKNAEETTAPTTKNLVPEIGKTVAENSSDLSSAVDWQCGQCESVNFARRQQCILCNAPKCSEVEEKAADAVKRVETDIKNLWVTGLAEKTTVNDLRALFSKYGKVSNAKIVKYRKTGIRDGFITMTSAKEALLCIKKLNQTELHGHIITVKRITRESSEPVKRDYLKNMQSVVPKRIPKTRFKFLG